MPAEHCKLAESLASEINEPGIIEEVGHTKYGKQYMIATGSQFESFIDTWDYCHCRKTRRMSDIDGSIKGKSKLTILDRFEAHLFAQSYNQKHGIDLDELFSPVARLATIRTVIALSTLLDLDEHQLDVKNAFLSGSLDDEITMRQPEGYVNKKHPDNVCKLERSIMDCDNVFV